jgi:hypothetical protein
MNMTLPVVVKMVEFAALMTGTLGPVLHIGKIEVRHSIHSASPKARYAYTLTL